MTLRKQDLVDLFSFSSRGLSQKVINDILKPTGRGGQYAARDYITANALLSEYYKANPQYSPESGLYHITDASELWGGIHPATKFRLKSYTPCLAARYDELKESEQKKLFEDPNWVATEKINGCRGWLICYNGDVKLYSRNYSDRDCGLLEYWNNIAQESTLTEGIYAIDVEIKFEPGVDISEDLERLGLETNSPLEAMVALLHTYPEEAVKIQNKFKDIYGKDLIVFRLIAPLYYKGKNFLNRTLGEGMDIYDECVEYGKSIGLNVAPISRCSKSREEKEIFLNSILENGGEGVVFHNRKGSYCTSENRSKLSFIKLKRTVSSQLTKDGMGDTIDGWISGFKIGSNGTANEGMISAFEISCYITNNGVQREHVIAYVPNIEKNVAQYATINDATGMWPTEVTLSNGEVKTVSLNPEFAYLVCECDGQSISSVSNRLTHPRLIRFRMEKSQMDCVYTQEFIDSQKDSNLK